MNALSEADGECANLQLGVEAGLVVVDVLLFVFVEEHALQLKQLAPGSEELVAACIIRRVGHGMLRISDVSLDLLIVVLTTI